MAERIGDFLKRIGAMNTEQLEDVLQAQQSGDSRPFGIIAIEKGYVTEDVIEKFAAAQKSV